MIDLRKIYAYQIIPKILFLFFIINSFLYLGCTEQDISEPNSTELKNVELWLTDAESEIYFEKQTDIEIKNSSEENLTILVDPSTKYQEIDGFGYALTGGSAFHIAQMSAQKRSALIRELFDYTENNIGVSYLRVSIGASDLDFEPFSYCDLPNGGTDINLENFSLDKDREYLIPVLKEILSVSPNIKILGSPWSPPTWMKTNKATIGGSLRSEFYDAYARYFVKYINEMKKEGINIDAITIQNEPLHPGNNPSMLMTAIEQANFIKNNLGPTFRDSSISTKIIIYDHNADRTDYPMTILNDAEARQYVDGSAFHLYGGEINALGLLHEAHPDKNLYFTEQWVGAGSDLRSTLKWHVWNLIIGGTRNWCKNVIEWNLAADENHDPHTDGGCDRCLGALTISGDDVTRNPAYYIIAHASKFVRPGSVRIESTLFDNLTNVSFLTPDGKIIVIVLNPNSTQISFNIKIGNEVISTTLAPDAVGTYVW